MPQCFGEIAGFDASGGGPASADAIAAYKRDGVICLRGAFGRDWLDTIESGIRLAMDQPGPSAAKVGIPGDRGSFYYDSIMWKHVEPFRRFVFDSHGADMFWPLLESATLNFYYDFLLLKAGHCGSAVTPWHHDQSFYPLNGSKIINCWTALDPIPTETALRFVRGSHGGDTIYRALHFDPAKTYPNSMMERDVPPDFDADPDAEMIRCIMEPGDTLVFNARTLHCAPGNTLDQRRGAFSTNWTGDDVTYSDIAQETDPSQRGENLVHGGPITCETFPLVRGST